MGVGAISIGRPVNAAHPLARSLAGFWLALPGRIGRTTIEDVSGKRNPGTLTNGPTWGGTPNGCGAVDFTDAGATNRVTSAVAAPTNNLLALGALVYCRTTQGSSPNIRQIAGWDDSTTGRCYLRLGDSGAPTFVEWVVNVSGEQVITSSTAMPLNQWVFLLGVYDGANQTLYQQGVSVATAARTGNINGGASGFVIGNTSAGDRPFDGRIPAVLYWSGGVPSPAVATTEARCWFPTFLARLPRKPSVFTAAAVSGNRRRRVLICGGAA